MREPYASIRPLQARAFPWFSEDKRKTLAMLLESMVTKFGKVTVLEVGSWVGDSARFFGHHRGVEQVYCIDTWAGPVDTHRFMLSNLYQQFLSNIIHAELTEKITPVRMKSTEAAIALTVKPHLIYLDGDHSAEGALLDFMVWGPHLAEGGVLCGDDWSWHTVQDGIKEAARVCNAEIAHDGETWWVKS
jgi:hypothetical protein